MTLAVKKVNNHLKRRKKPRDPGAGEEVFRQP
jgi:hypothetical protein